MGVHELWKLVERQDVAEVTTLEEQAADTKERHDAHGAGAFRPMIIGIDAPVIMSQCIAGTYGANQFNGMVPLEIFFYKLCRYLQTWSAFVFVFDGPERPQRKRDRDIPVADEPDWYGPCQKLVREFGFSVHMAPGEAEAELAVLNEKGLIDFVLTADSDALVFGARSVIRSTTVNRSPSTITRDPDLFGIIKTYRLLEKEPAAFTRGGMLLMALLLGGDYAKGVHGCGAVTSFGLAKCGFGDSLFEASQTLHGSARREFLGTWLADVCHELRTNSRGHLQERNFVAANHLSEETFPSNNIIDFYVNPVTSFSHGHHGVDVSGWTVAEPNIKGIARLAFEHLGSNFRRTDDITKRFYNNVWPGALKQMLISGSLLVLPADMTIKTSGSTAEVRGIREAPRRTQRQSTIPRWFRIAFSTVYLAYELQTALTTLDMRPARTNPGHKGSSTPSTISIWVPAQLLSPIMQAMAKPRRVPRHRLGNHADTGQTSDNESLSMAESSAASQGGKFLTAAAQLTSDNDPSNTDRLSVTRGGGDVAGASSSLLAALDSVLHKDSSNAAESSEMGAQNALSTHHVETIDLTNETIQEPAAPGHRYLGILDLTNVAADDDFSIENGQVVHHVDDA